MKHQPSPFFAISYWCALLLFALLFFIALISPWSAQAACTKLSCKILVVGDMGIGEEPFNHGFEVVQKQMVAENPDLVLYLGDYIYSQHACDKKNDDGSYVDAVERFLVKPFGGRNVVFSRGDNDKISAKQLKRYPELASATQRCWSKISKMGRGLKQPLGAQEAEGIIDSLPNVFIAVLDNEAFTENKIARYHWLKKYFKKAKADKKWIIVMMHAPVITTAWYEGRCCQSLKILHDMGVDMVFSGHQHSYERSFPVRLNRRANRAYIAQRGQRFVGKTKEDKARGVSYRAGRGVIYFVSGGGGALLRPFADQQKLPKFLKSKIAPRHIRKLIAKRAIMNHYITLDLSAKDIDVKTHQICTFGEARWKADNTKIWTKGTKTLACDGRPIGKTLFERFRLRR